MARKPDLFVLTCYSCGAALELESGVSTYVCPYCGTRHTLFSQDEPGPDVERLQVELDQAKAERDLPELRQKLAEVEAGLDAATYEHNKMVRKLNSAQRRLSRAVQYWMAAGVSGLLGLLASTVPMSNARHGGDIMWVGVGTLEYILSSFKGIQTLHAIGFFLLFLCVLFIFLGFSANAWRYRATVKFPAELDKWDKAVQEWTSMKSEIQQLIAEQEAILT